MNWLSARRPMSLATEWHQCKPGHLKSGCRVTAMQAQTFKVWTWSNSNASLDIWSLATGLDRVAFPSSQWTSPESLRPTRLAAILWAKKIWHLPKFLSYATIDSTCSDTGPLRNMLFVDFSYRFEWFSLIIKHLHINSTVFKYNQIMIVFARSCF